MTGRKPHVRAEKPDAGAPARPPLSVTFDLMADDGTCFVLTEALRDFAARERADAADGDDPETRTRWAEAAEAALDRIEAAFSDGTEQASARDRHVRPLRQLSDDRLKPYGPARGMPDQSAGPET